MPLLFSWLLNLVYGTGILLASPWIAWAAWRHGKYREGFGEKFLGSVPKRTGDAPCLWLHAVSVGEVNLLATIIDRWQAAHREWDIVVSTTTKTGFDLARKMYAGHSVFYCPLDFSWATRAAVARVRPDLLVLAELELWPNLIRAAKLSGAKTAVVNGRLSDNSFRGYRRIRWLLAPVVRGLDAIAAQDAATADRFVQLGARPESVVTTGSLKFDGAQTDRNNPRTAELRKLAGIGEDETILLCGSTQQPEEEYAMEIFTKLRSEFPRLRLILVPRHPERFDEVATLLAKSGLTWTRRSQLEKSAIRNPQSEILLVDAVGELGAWWGVASIGFVGGSFGSRGGQNMLEPAGYGVATSFGPNTSNFRDIVAQLLSVDAAVVVNSRDELEAYVRRALTDPTWARNLGQRARELVLSQQGATERTIKVLESLCTTRSKQNSAAA